MKLILMLIHLKITQYILKIFQFLKKMRILMNKFNNSLKTIAKVLLFAK